MSPTHVWKVIDNICNIHASYVSDAPILGGTYLMSDVVEGHPLCCKIAALPLTGGFHQLHCREFEWSFPGN